ncbi:MAG: chromosome segregation protein SMC [Gracilibacteraceae bacterium]|jgi:chromosome segregation protein|nr:chromosome segregation protein SMC [Gracilibacteraceae bacterium]
MDKQGMNSIFLKSITIQGFKSFADRLRIDLQDGMSVVVGPNGCGKSNIADAIRWVLGEQSAKNLRGGRMDDVIFAGSRTRKQVGMAEVSLHFDNSGGYFALDYAEVTVTRRVFRDGDSEFFINKAPCRLRDIQELFLDTGAGKEGFSVIGQGQVEQMLNLKADERRFLIEEAAGISKFRLRKKEALKKLEDTEINLSRVSDIVAEVAARLEPLAKQAAEAETFQIWERELRELEIGQLVRAGRELEEKLTAAAERREEREERRASLAAAAAAGEKACLTARLTLDGLEEELRLRREEIHAAETETQAREHDLALGAERGRHLLGERERLREEMEAGRERGAARQAKLAAERGRAAELTESLAAGRARLSAWEADWAALRGAGEKRRETLKAEIFGVLSRQSALQNECADARHSLAAQDKDDAQRLEEKTRCGAELERAESAITQLAAEAERNAGQQAELTRQISEITRRGQEMSAESERLAAEERAAGRKLEQIRARRQALRQLGENMEGYRRGVRDLVRAVRRGELRAEGFLGTVADNLEVSAAYENAVSTALGGALQDVIVTEAVRGQEYIAWLRAGRRGRATFLPLDTLRPGEAPKPELFQDVAGFVGVAADLAVYPPAVDKAIRFLLGRILVAADMEAALLIARRCGFRYRVVTLEGDQVNVGGSLTGGSEGARDDTSGLLRRRREIEELGAEEQTARTELNGLAARRSALVSAGGVLAAERDEALARRQETEKKKELLGLEQKHHLERRDALTERLKLIEFECRAGRERREEAEAARLEEERRALSEQKRAAATKRAPVKKSRA